VAKFIEIDDTIVNIESIRKAVFLSDDVYLGLFPRDTNKEILVDCIPFTFGQIELNTGEKIDLDIDLYPPEGEETEESWIGKNRAYINMSWGSLTESLGHITKATGYEYGL